MVEASKLAEPPEILVLKQFGRQKYATLSEIYAKFIVGVIHILITLLLITCFLFLSSCSGSYNSNEAIERGDIVELHGQVTNLERVDTFLNNIEDDKKDDIRITMYTIEGDPIY